MSIKIGSRVAVVSRRTGDISLFGRVVGWTKGSGTEVQLEFGSATKKRRRMSVRDDDMEWMLAETFKKE